MSVNADRDNPLRLAAVSRGEAKYFPGFKCFRGHVSRRYSCSGRCIMCLAEDGRNYARTPKGKAVQQRKDQKKMKKRKEQKPDMKPLPFAAIADRRAPGGRYTYGDVTAALRALMQRAGRTVAFGVLSQAGRVSSVRDLDVNKYDAVVIAANATEGTAPTTTPTDNEAMLLAAMKRAEVAPNLYSALKLFLRDHGMGFGESMDIAHHFEAVLRQGGPG